MRGLVTGPGGEPVEGAHVEVINDGWPRAAPSAARTGADGRFTLDGVTAQARFRLRATAHGYEPYESYQMSATPGASLDDVLLPLPAATESFLGRVVDERGIPRPEVHVCIRPALPGIGAEAGGGEAWTGTGGRYRVEVRAGYAWEVLVAMKGFDGTPSAPFRAGETVPDLVLRPVEAAPK